MNTNNLNYLKIGYKIDINDEKINKSDLIKFILSIIVLNSNMAEDAVKASTYLNNLKRNESHENIKKIKDFLMSFIYDSDGEPLAQGDSETVNYNVGYLSYKKIDNKVDNVELEKYIDEAKFTKLFLSVLSDKL